MHPVHVLFICVHNSGRSQMAEAYLNSLGQGRYLGFSAGYDPRPVCPVVVKAMAEDGLDISGVKSKHIFDFYKSGHIFNWVITVCDIAHEDHEPVFPGVTSRLHIPFTDPASLSGSEEEKLPKVRKIRDSIKSTIQDLIKHWDSGELAPRLIS